tara:strand:+ start:163 stop:465 length:303 start_codon:yes stop_codon:yes gene_type:complete
MLSIKPILFLFFVFFFINSSSFACSFDLDCSIGSKCIKAYGAIYGVCGGGLFPGNSNDSEPVYDPLDLDGTYGNTCSFDLDCGITNKCVKDGNSIYGVCM